MQLQMKEFSTGDIIFVLQIQKMQIIPGLVKEKTIKHTIDKDVVTNYVIKFSDSEEIDSSTLTDAFQVFSNLEEARNYMLAYVQQLIDKKCTTALKESESLKVSKKENKINV